MQLVLLSNDIILYVKISDSVNMSGAVQVSLVFVFGCLEFSPPGRQLYVDPLISDTGIFGGDNF